MADWLVETRLVSDTFFFKVHLNPPERIPCLVEMPEVSFQASPGPGAKQLVIQVYLPHLQPTLSHSL